MLSYYDDQEYFEKDELRKKNKALLELVEHVSEQLIKANKKIEDLLEELDKYRAQQE